MTTEKQQQSRKASVAGTQGAVKPKKLSPSYNEKHDGGQSDSEIHWADVRRTTR